MNPNIAVIGNPNCGKTTLFNALTGSKQKVGNWSGVTIDKKIGQFKVADQTVDLVDLPGTYSLDVNAQTPLDEKIARDYALSGGSQLIINILDASNLERNLYLTAQLLEMKIPLIVVLNMVDVANRNGLLTDAKALEKRLGCPVIALSANNKKDISALKECISQGLKLKKVSSHVPIYEPNVAQAAAKIASSITINNKPLESIDTHWLSLRLLEQDESCFSYVDQQTLALAKAEFEQFADHHELDVLFANGRYEFAHQLAELAQNTKGIASETISDKIDAVVINRFLGIPIFLGIMYLMFTIAVNVGSAFIDFFDIAVGAILVDGFGEILTSLGAPDWLRALLADGLGGGIQLVATFIPVIGFLYFCLAFIEDSGYMARAAFIMDRLMRAIGLPGKAFVPLIVGFGCNVPSVMATRTLETHKDRLLTIAMSPFMSCGARLSVYALFVAAFFTTNGQNLVFALYILGIVMAVLTGLVLKNTLFSPTLTPFILELPAYHMPTAKGVLYKAWERLKSFCMRAGKTIIVVFVILKILSSIGTDFTFGNDNTDKSMLSEISKIATPVFAPIGVEQDNWPATVGIFTGVFAKEAVVGTLDSLYSNLDSALPANKKPVNVINKVAEAFASIPTNLADVFGNLLDPLGLKVTNVSDQSSAAIDQEVNVSTFATMENLFSSQLAAFSYLVFVLLYTPCLAVMGAMYREAGMKWMLFVASWSTGLAYITASVVYQVGNFKQSPTFSIFWLFGCAVVIALAISAMRIYGNKMAAKSRLIPVVNII
ncbi:Fe(2+) transporter permease subunit FeoB [Pseudoalteromonas arctica]|uniref:Ferrous iron transport protein B n=1 Tax=Pseudoalteromonas arctica TaxID=394751 RepID=A0A7Y0HCD3_9GAMM|nr:Fe(2+) transporter permease subunit FeoB [Pseudoalteromonas arctica]NMM39939.1 Fe(2+) transporter permease subunit FeoB [Pseudoalteromonas arctica]